MAEKGDLAKGRARWEETKAWRASEGVDSILSTPHPKFDLIKSFYPHAFHMRSREGLCVYYEVSYGPRMPTPEGYTAPFNPHYPLPPPPTLPSPPTTHHPPPATHHHPPETWYD